MSDQDQLREDPADATEHVKESLTELKEVVEDQLEPAKTVARDAGSVIRFLLKAIPVVLATALVVVAVTAYERRT